MVVERNTNNKRAQERSWESNCQRQDHLIRVERGMRRTVGRGRVRPTNPASAEAQDDAAVLVLVHFGSKITKTNTSQSSPGDPKERDGEEKN